MLVEIKKNRLGSDSDKAMSIYVCEKWEQIHENLKRTEHLVNYGTTQVSQAALSVTTMANYLWDYSECHCIVMHLLPLNSDWRLLLDRIWRGIPKTQGHIKWQELHYVIAVAASKCLGNPWCIMNPFWWTFQ